MDRLGGRGGEVDRAERLDQRRLAGDHVAAGFGQPVGVEQQRAVRGEVEVAGHVGAALAQAERHAAGRQRRDPARGVALQRRRVARAGARQRRPERVEHADPGGREAVRGLPAQHAIGRVEHHRGVGVDRRRAAQALADRRHRRGRVQAAARDVADREHHPPVGDPKRVVPVAADLRLAAAGFVERVERRAGNPRQVGRQRRGLERARHPPLARVGLGVADRGRDPARDLGEERHVGCLVAPARAAVVHRHQRAAHRAAVDERHDGHRADAERPDLVAVRARHRAGPGRGHLRVHQRLLRAHRPRASRRRRRCSDSAGRAARGCARWRPGRGAARRPGTARRPSRPD